MDQDAWVHPTRVDDAALPGTTDLEYVQKHFPSYSTNSSAFRVPTVARFQAQDSVLRLAEESSMCTAARSWPNLRDWAKGRAFISHCESSQQSPSRETSCSSRTMLVLRG